MTPTPTETRWWQRALQRVAATRPGSWLFSKTTHHVDRVLLEHTGGRVSTSTVLAGLPTVRLTTTGAKTGTERTVPVMGIRDGDRWVVVASNWGGDGHPAWYYNLRADPEVELSHRGERDSYVARELDGERREQYWNRACELYVGFEAYRHRSGDREIPVVELVPVDE
jgi:deazaflavin-dependent oxidoreductase (nitroreductase family)